MVQPGYIKEGKLLLKGVKKFVRYKQDLITSERMAKIDESCAAFRGALEERDKEKAERLAQELTVNCEKSVPEYRGSAWRENVEVIFVAVVIAVGIRAYFLQPFKIPTGSMQPTLNGVIAYDRSESEEFEEPGFVRRAFEYLQLGRNYVNVVAEQEDRVERIYEQTRMKFFTFTKIECASGKTYTVYAPLSVAMTDLGMQRIFGYLTSGGRPSNARIFPDQVLARGYVDTGDQVLVDKLSYHFRRPRRGEVFVFTTNGIRGINTPAMMGSQHYIKRLAGVPGDQIDVEAPYLNINGKRAEEPGFRRVMSRENGYPGYTNEGVNLHVQLEERQYFAMGDNSASSSDSRMWGKVPEDNLVGCALFVYWPFSSHWGVIH